MDKEDWIGNTYRCSFAYMFCHTSPSLNDLVLVKLYNANGTSTANTSKESTEANWYLAGVFIVSL